MGQAESIERKRSSRAAQVFCFLLLVCGCLVLWIGVPVGAMWLAGRLTDSFGAHMPIALALTIAGMLVVGIALAWLNDLYLRVSGGEIVISHARPVRRRGPLEPMLAVCFAAAALAFAFWFLVLAENPSLNVW